MYIFLSDSVEWTSDRLGFFKLRSPFDLSWICLFEKWPRYGAESYTLLILYINFNIQKKSVLEIGSVFYFDEWPDLPRFTLVVNTTNIICNSSF